MRAIPHMRKQISGEDAGLNACFVIGLKDPGMNLPTRLRVEDERFKRLIQTHVLDVNLDFFHDADGKKISVHTGIPLEVYARRKKIPRGTYLGWLPIYIETIQPSFSNPEERQEWYSRIWDIAGERFGITRDYAPHATSFSDVVFSYPPRQEDREQLRIFFEDESLEDLALHNNDENKAQGIAKCFGKIRKYVRFRNDLALDTDLEYRRINERLLRTAPEVADKYRG